MITLFDGQENESLSSIRRRNSTKKIEASKTFFGPDRLLSTSSFTKHHSL